jgi:spore coat protein A
MTKVEKRRNNMREKTCFGATVILALALILTAEAPSAWANSQILQTPLSSKTLAKYGEQLPTFVGARATGSSIGVTYNEFQEKVLPNSFYSLLPASVTLTDPAGATLGTINPQQGTYVWGYGINGSVFASGHYPGLSIVAQKGTPTTVTYTNVLPTSTTINPAGPILQKFITIDQSIHWANPGNLPMLVNGLPNPARMVPYLGPQPVVPHLHGAEVPSAFDGGPDQWFTPTGLHGAGYRTISGAASNEVIFRYPNTQEAATLWYHEHTLGATRTNVYAGLAGFYLLRDSYDTGVAGTGLNLPAGDQEVEIVIQDRMFDTNGQLFFPDVGLNPEHPFWIPEFIGDTIVVNGKSWPNFTVEPRRYRLRLLNGSNARFYNMSFQFAGNTKQKGKLAAPAFYVIGNDGGLLDQAQMTPTLLFAPGERYDVIVDFSAVAGQTLILSNDARTPYPGGGTVDPSTTAQLMQFTVGTTVTGGTDTSFNPVAIPTLRDGTTGKPSPMVRLADVTTAGLPSGTLGAGVNPVRVRQLTLNEVMGPGGPLEILVNNTKWEGKRPPPDNSWNADFSPFTINTGIAPAGTGTNDATNYLSELPQVGSTEVWEIINITADAHPIHLHLVQFQLLNRQPIKLNGNKGYLKAYDAAFPGGVFIPAYGPPMAYNTVQGTEALPVTGGGTVNAPIIGGNPDVTPFLSGPAVPPAPYEMGWKDMMIVMPGEVSRFVVRWTPLDTPLGSETPGTSQYAFDPTNFGNPTDGVVTSDTNPEGAGYVWHCHIIDHEDNEMMRPYIPVNNPDNVKD